MDIIVHSSSGRERLHVQPCWCFAIHVKLTAISAVQEWPQDALEAVARKFLNDMPLQKPVQTKLVPLCHAIHCKVSSMMK